jgi:hypothetical protein
VLILYSRKQPIEPYCLEDIHAGLWNWWKREMRGSDCTLHACCRWRKFIIKSIHMLIFCLEKKIRTEKSIEELSGVTYIKVGCYFPSAYLNIGRNCKLAHCLPKHMNFTEIYAICTCTVIIVLYFLWFDELCWIFGILHIELDIFERFNVEH